MSSNTTTTSNTSTTTSAAPTHTETSVRDEEVVGGGSGIGGGGVDGVGSPAFVAPRVGTAAAMRAEALARMQARMNAERANPFDQQTPPSPIRYPPSTTTTTTTTSHHVAIPTPPLPITTSHEGSPSTMPTTTTTTSSTTTATTTSTTAIARPSLITNCPSCGAVIGNTKAATCLACGQQLIAQSSSSDGEIGERSSSITTSTAPAAAIAGKNALRKLNWKDFLSRPANAKDDEEERRSRLQTQSEETDHTVTRSNLFNICKLAIKVLIESAIGLSERFGDSHFPLTQLCLVLEQCLRTGLKEKKSFLSSRGLWGLMESAEKQVPSWEPTTRNVRSLPGFRTFPGRARAWIRVALMEKQLSELLKDCVHNEAFTAEWYEPWAFMRSEDAIVLCGLLVGLHFMDFDLSIQGEYLDTLSTNVDYSLYLKDGNYLKAAISQKDREDERFSEEQFNTLTDQKVYLDELNRNLKLQVNELKAQLALELASKDEATKNITAIEASLTASRAAHSEAVQLLENAKLEYERKLRLQAADVDAERATYQQSRTGLDEIFHAMDKQLATERNAREAADADIVRLMNTKREWETQRQQLETEIQTKEAAILELQSQGDRARMDHATSITVAQDLQTRVLSREAELTRVSTALREATDRIASQQGQLQEASDRVTQLQTLLLNVTEKLKDVDLRRGVAEKNLTSEKQTTEQLTQQLEIERARASEAETQRLLMASSLEATRMQLTQQKAEFDRLKKKYDDQEKTVVELGDSLTVTALKVHSLEDKERRTQELHWTDESTATNCFDCNKEFNITRRKHHCRRCGKVFCNECSDNRMPLPSSARAVRVCNKCQSELLKAMTANQNKKI